jgi:CheY-like chemotaxis protein
MSTERFTVLLVGKTSRNAGKLLDYLKLRDCVVRSAGSYENAAALLRDRKFDLALSDFLDCFPAHADLERH